MNLIYIVFVHYLRLNSTVSALNEYLHHAIYVNDIHNSQLGFSATRSYELDSQCFILDSAV